jgi:hypothetical protein
MKLKPLTPGQANALQMTLDGHHRDYICEKLGITHKTLWNWRQLPAWDEQVTVALQESSGYGQAQAKTPLPVATQVLRRFLLTATDQVRLGAARTVLEAHANLVAREEQQQLMRQLEQQLEKLRTVVANSGVAGQLTASAYDAVDAEIMAHSHDLSHTEQQQEAEAE